MGATYHGDPGSSQPAGTRDCDPILPLLELTTEVAREVLGGPRSDAVLARAVARVSHAYTRQRGRIDTLTRDPEALEARLRFFLPRDLPKIERPLEELASVGALPRTTTWRVLDLGAGLGTTSLGVAAFAAKRSVAVEVTGVDRDARALKVFEALAARMSASGLGDIRLTSRTGDLVGASSAVPEGPFNLILLGLVVNELAAGPRPRATSAVADELASLAHHLTPDGSLIVVEPALRTTSRFLQEIRDHLVTRGNEVGVFAPCVTGGRCPLLENERDWCHAEIPTMLPPPLDRWARAAGLRYGRLTYSYLTLRRDGRTLRSAAGDAARGEVLRIVSGQRKMKGKRELVGCGRPGAVQLTRLDRHASPSNALFAELERGDLVTVEAQIEGRSARVERENRVEPIPFRPGHPAGDSSSELERR